MLKECSPFADLSGRAPSMGGGKRYKITNPFKVLGFARKRVGLPYDWVASCSVLVSSL